MAKKPSRLTRILDFDLSAIVGKRPLETAQKAIKNAGTKKK